MVTEEELLRTKLKESAEICANLMTMREYWDKRRDDTYISKISIDLQCAIGHFARESQGHWLKLEKIIKDLRGKNI